MIVDKRKYSSWQKSTQRTREIWREMYIQPGVHFNFFIILTPDLRAGYLLISILFA